MPAVCASEEVAPAPTPAVSTDSPAPEAAPAEPPAVINAPAPAAGDEGTGPLIEIVEIKGLVRTDEGAVRGKITQNSGAPISPEAVTADIKAIFDLGYYQDVQVEVEPYEGGLKLTYNITEKPFVRVLDYFGNDEVDNDKIEAALTIKAGSLADTLLIRDNAELIRNAYEDSGFPLARIVPVLHESGDGRLTLVYQIIEGPRVRIGDILFKGNESYTSWRLRRQMETRKWGIFSWLFGTGKYTRTQLHDDLITLRSFYNDRGYMKAVIGEPAVTYEEDKRWLDITIPVEEGLKYTLDGINIEGDDEVAEAERREALKSIVGKPVSRALIRDDVDALTGIYTERGYAQATIRPDIKMDDQAARATLLYHIAKGDKFYVRHINIRLDLKGTLDTRDKVIRREFRQYEGELFNSRKIRRSMEGLQNLNYFDDVKLDVKPDAPNKTLDLGVKVKGKPTGSFNVGGGYSTLDKFVGMADLVFGNLGGRGQYLKFSTQFSSSATQYQAEFRDPWLFDKPYSFSATIQDTKRDYTQYQKHSKGFGLSLGRRFLDYWSTSVAYSYDDANVYGVSNYASALVNSQAGQYVTSSVTWSLGRDSRNNRLDPHNGSNNYINLTYAGIGGDRYFGRIQLDSQYYFPATRHSEFMLRGRYGAVDSFAGRPLPLDERFYVGSVYTVRGIHYIGPHDSNGFYIGGRERMIFNAEYSFPLDIESRLKGIFFTDAGSAYDRQPGVPYLDNIQLRYSYGFGIRWISPLGPIQIFYSVNPANKYGEPPFRWEFSIGALY